MKEISLTEPKQSLFLKKKKQKYKVETIILLPPTRAANSIFKTIIII